MRKRLVPLLLLPLASLAGAIVDSAPGSEHGARAGYPTGIAAAGDSLSTGFASNGQAGDHEENSWSTGANPVVGSHYERILSAAPKIAGRAVVVARDGARIRGLAAQMERVVRRGDIDYVTVQIGVNDICAARRESEITPVASFRAAFRQALEVLHRGAPDARVLVTSLADEARWNDAVLRIPGRAVQIRDGTVCDPRPGPDGRQSPVVRARIHRWEEAYDRVLASVCSQFLHCRYDGGALFRLRYAPGDVSSRDAFHPSVEGLARMARVTWRATFDFTDRTPPVATATVHSGPSGTSVTLRARDNVGVRGIEYRLGEEPWVPYTTPLHPPHGVVLSYRAVDVNGNISATHTIVP